MSNSPIFENIFGIPWRNLPPVMQKHYAIRPFSGDRVTVQGTMNIRRNWLARLLSPFLTMLGALVPFDGNTIPVTVTFYSGEKNQNFYFDRIFHFPGRPPFAFLSRLEPTGGNEVIEFMRSGIGWRANYTIHNQTVMLRHIGYVWKIGGLTIALPLSWLIGKGAAAEEALSDDRFSMWMNLTHPLFGELYRYEGTFKITDAVHA